MAQHFRSKRAEEAEAILLKNHWLASTKSIRIKLALTIGLFAFFIYYLTLYPTLGGGDSGELSAVACSLGIAHPPGYPLFTLLGNLFTWIPFGTIAWRVNLLSAFCDAAAAFMICLAVSRWTRHVWAGFVAAGLFAFSPLIWSYAVVAEIFPLNNLFISLFLWLTLLYQDTQDTKLARIGAFTFGLALTNHHTFIFYGVFLSAWVLWTGRKSLFKPKEMTLLIGLFFFGLLPYLYLPIASARVPVIAWGNPSTWEGFIQLLTRHDYGTFRLHIRGDADQGGLFDAFYFYIKSLPLEFLGIGGLIALLGIWKTPKDRKTFTWITLGGFITYFIVFHSLANLSLNNSLSYSVHIRFWQQLNILISAWIGLGFAWLFSQPIIQKFIKYQIIPILALSLVILQMAVHYHTQDQHENWAFAQLGKALLLPLENNSIFFNKGDIFTNASRYMQTCEGIRPDIHILDRSLLTYDWAKPNFERNHPGVIIPGNRFLVTSSGYSLEQLLTVNINRYPIYFTDLDEFEKESHASVGTYILRSEGLIYRVNQPSLEFNFTESYQKHKKMFSYIDLSLLKKFQNQAWEHLLLVVILQKELQFGYELVSYGTQTGRSEALELGIQVWEKTLQDSSDLPAYQIEPSIYKNLGIAYSYLSKIHPEAKAKMIHAFQEFLRLAPINNPDRPLVQKTLQMQQ